MDKQLNFRTLTLTLTAAGMLAACGGSGGGGGGASSETKAALAGAAVLGLAQTGVAMAEDAEDDQMAKASSTEACDSGSITSEDGSGAGPSGAQASPYHSGNFTISKTDANQCRYSYNESGFSFSSYMNGSVEFGEAAGATVSYIVADDYVMQTSGSDFPSMDMAMDGVMHLCDGCASPEDSGADFEIKAFMNMDMDFDGQRFIMGMGSSLSDMLTMSSSGVTGGTGTHVINGRMKAEVPGTSCSFDATYATIEPMITSNAFTAEESVESGEFDISIVGSGTHRVVISGGVVSVDGVAYTEEELAAMEEDCDMDF